MKKLAAVRSSVASEAGPRPDILMPSDNDTLLAMMMALAGELAVLYERVDTIERVVEQELGLPREKLESFIAPPAVLAERSQWHEAFVTRLTRSLAYEVERLKAEGGASIPERSGGD